MKQFSLLVTSIALLSVGIFNILLFLLSLPAIPATMLPYMLTMLGIGLAFAAAGWLLAAGNKYGWFIGLAGVVAGIIISIYLMDYLALVLYAILSLLLLYTARYYGFMARPSTQPAFPSPGEEVLGMLSSQVWKRRRYRFVEVEE